MREEVHAGIRERWCLVPQRLKRRVQLAAFHLCAPARLVVHELVSKADDEGRTLKWLSASSQRSLVQEMQDEVEPRHRVLIIDHVGDWRKEPLRFMVSTVRAKVSAWPMNADFVGFGLERGCALHDDCTYEAPMLASGCVIGLRCCVCLNAACAANEDGRSLKVLAGECVARIRGDGVA